MGWLRSVLGLINIQRVVDQIRGGLARKWSDERFYFLLLEYRYSVIYFLDLHTTPCKRFDRSEDVQPCTGGYSNGVFK